MFCFCGFFVSWWRFGEFQGHHWIPRQISYQNDVQHHMVCFQQKSWPFGADRDRVTVARSYLIVITSMTPYIIIRKQNLIIFNRFRENECRRTDRQSIAIKELHFVSPLNNNAVDRRKTNRQEKQFHFQSISQSNGTTGATHSYTSK